MKNRANEYLSDIAADIGYLKKYLEAGGCCKEFGVGLCKRIEYAHNRLRQELNGESRLVNKPEGMKT